MKKLILILALAILVVSCDPVESYDRCQAGGHFTDIDCGLGALAGMFFGRVCGMTMFGQVPCQQHRN